MHAQAMWRKFDDRMRAKFDGRLGQMAYREIVSLMFMGIAHTMIKQGLNPRYHAELDKVWYGSIPPGNPVHGLRSRVQEAAAGWAAAMDAHCGSPLQTKLQVIDEKVPTLERFIDSRAADLDRWVAFLHRSQR